MKQLQITVLFPDNILDGYRLIRPIGTGGFGEVWLCRAEATGEWRALKVVPAMASRHLERELDALIHYRAVAVKLQCPSLLPIEHINRNEHGLYYVMPLADGLNGDEPCAETWQPKTLAALISERRNASAWFSEQEVLEMITPLLHAAQRLSDAGIVHRDIKPENILFIGGLPVLADISLLGEDKNTLTGRGTPGYAPASWYLETGGNPDMWGIACTLYALLSGNAPDKIGRAALMWPPQGEAAVNGPLWHLWHRAVLRAIDEEPAERFRRFADMAASLAAVCSAPPSKAKARPFVHFWLIATIMLLIGGLWSGWRIWNAAKGTAKAPVVQSVSPVASVATPAKNPIEQVSASRRRTKTNHPQQYARRTPSAAYALKGKVLQVTNEGMVVDSLSGASFSASFDRGGGRPEVLNAWAFVVGHPRQNSIAVGDSIDVDIDAKELGDFTYQPSKEGEHFGVSAIIPKYKVIQTFQ